MAWQAGLGEQVGRECSSFRSEIAANKSDAFTFTISATRTRFWHSRTNCMICPGLQEMMYAGYAERLLMGARQMQSFLETTVLWCGESATTLFTSNVSISGCQQSTMTRSAPSAVGPGNSRLLPQALWMKDDLNLRPEVQAFGRTSGHCCTSGKNNIESGAFTQMMDDLAVYILS